MKFIFSGGGTLGSVTPLIAIIEEIKNQRPDAEFLWLATKAGPEEKLLAGYGIPVKKIFSGKLRRYFSWRNLIDPIFIFFGFWQSFFIIKKFRPKAVVSAGGFVSVPVIWAARLLKKKILIHQQDIVPGLANKLMAPAADIISVTFEKSLADFGKKAVLTGNPARPEILAGSRLAGLEYFHLSPDLPAVLIIGGGTGAENLNRLVQASAPGLIEFCQVIHLTGGRQENNFNHERYRVFDFLTDQLANAFACSDLVVSRGGLGTLTELAALGKPSIIIPMPGTHQEANAVEFYKNNAVLTLEENKLSPDDLTKAVASLLLDKPLAQSLARNMAKMLPVLAARKIVDLILYGQTG